MPRGEGGKRTTGNKEAVVRVMTDYINKGLTRKDVLTKTCEKFQFSSRTFDKFWRLASDRLQEAQDAANKEVIRVEAQMIAERRKRGVLNREERMVIASNIAKGKPRKIGKEYVYPTETERIRALDFLAKVEGDYKPELHLAMQQNNTTVNQTTIENNNTQNNTTIIRKVVFKTRETVAEAQIITE